MKKHFKVEKRAQSPVFHFEVVSSFLSCPGHRLAWLPNNGLDKESRDSCPAIIGNQPAYVPSLDTMSRPTFPFQTEQVFKFGIGKVGA